jgi:hypothetical protein
VLGFVVSVGGRSHPLTPRTGRRVQYASITGGIWGGEFAGGHR